MGFKQQYIQITAIDKTTTEMRDIAIGNVFKVVKIKYQNNERWYYINAVSKFGNSIGKKNLIRVKFSECKITTSKTKILFAK